MNSILLQQKLSDATFYIAINFWYVFLIIAILFFLLSIKLFKDKAILKYKLRNQNDAFEKLSHLRKIGEIEAFLGYYCKIIEADVLALYLRRGDIYILESKSNELKDIEVPPRVYKRELKEYKKLSSYHIYYLESHYEKALLAIFTKKELAIEEIRGFLDMFLAYYERLNELYKEINLTTIFDSSKNLLTNIMKYQHGTETFLKFVVSLLLKTTHATGMVLKNRENPKKIDIFKHPQEYRFKKDFYIRNTPYILEIYTKDPMSEKEITEVGSFLDLAGSYFENLDASSKMVANYVDFLKLSNKALEMQSKYFRNHAQKVKLVSIEIGKNLFLDEASIDILALGAELHDIGMIGKIENFLDSGKIDKKELDLIRYHPIVGSVIVEPINNVYPIAPIIKYHHERFDGTGYPYGLKGKDIPLLAQIVALAEYYIGVTSPRAYRKAYSHEEALADIKKQKDKLVEGNIIDAFVQNHEGIREKLQVLQTKENL
ncbi:HD-GYP domain-containing protein [Nitratiruptor tergarcus]|uniref:Response regulator containing a CheY-like receiver domain and an HD-GYP domain n=1 Tax=Nitratiruptor tergarcus DSM 16512 TaxID=1069081 RepID=A0A1W1WUP5_9BACT|nr:HD domain-containing phosphohydrolase [Nitratiruptor tergarcus]SMC10038.1 Response regulator containing a CheY-like receiver domain and an HD-GYP domain [Nitratiruptor tergarcus DSM 16512]